MATKRRHFPTLSERRVTEPSMREAAVLTPVHSHPEGREDGREDGRGGGIETTHSLTHTQKHSSCFPLRHTIERQVNPSGGLTQMNCVLPGPQLPRPLPMRLNWARAGRALLRVPLSAES